MSSNIIFVLLMISSVVLCGDPVRVYKISEIDRQDSDQNSELLAETSEYLDEKIEETIRELPDVIEHAVEKIEHSLQLKIFKRTLQGWAVVFGHIKEIIGEFVAGNHSLGNIGTMRSIYEYGRLGFYGVGFGFPILLGLPDSELKCGAQDFENTLHEYYLSDGLKFLLSQNISIESVSSIVGEFDAMARTRLSCILEFSFEKKDALEVQFGLDELNALVNLRINVAGIERESESSNETESLRRTSSFDYDQINQIWSNDFLTS